MYKILSELISKFNRGNTEYKGFPGFPVIKNPPANHEMQVQSLSREDPLKREMSIDFSISRKSHGQRSWWVIVHGIAKELGNLSTKQQQQNTKYTKIYKIK